MANGDILNTELEFKEHLKQMTAEEKIDFVALEVFYQRGKIDKISATQDSIEGRLHDVEAACKGKLPEPPKTKSTITNAASGGITGAIVGGVIALIEYFRGGH